MPGKNRNDRKLPNNIFGTTRKQFVEVERVFRKNFIDGWEREGVAIAVFRNDELVVDLQGGYYMQAHSIFGHLTP
ncbi:hypothetical protein X798_07912 [Onchocerca flexuosa]|uniref:Uncharacterized protein n=1 Tax=Onchocerca flexuosa TaxID=387005 RepID=A0A238BKP3_9BILA|nr:hypothetical protein X798_07912 [Onchocerca flexuosa]